MFVAAIFARRPSAAVRRAWLGGAGSWGRLAPAEISDGTSGWNGPSDVDCGKGLLGADGFRFGQGVGIPPCEGENP